MKTEKEFTVACPNCQQKVIWNKHHSFKPFCSERCKLIDLGEWAAEEKSIPGDPLSSELDVDYDLFLNNPH